MSALTLMHSPLFMSGRVYDQYLEKNLEKRAQDIRRYEKPPSSCAL